MSIQAKRKYLSIEDVRRRGVEAKETSQQQNNPLLADAKGHLLGRALADDEIVLRSVIPTIKAIDAKKRTIEFIITTDDVDRENDVIAADGWDLVDYEKNPVVLFGHDHYALPVAQSQRIWREANGLNSIAEFTPEDLYPFGYMVFCMYEKGFMRAVSVGFKPKEYTYDESRKWGINFYQQALLEYSCVPVPANPNALVSARSAGIDLTPMKIWAERIMDDAAFALLPEEQRNDYEAIWRASTERRKTLTDFYTGVKAKTAVRDTTIVEIDGVTIPKDVLANVKAQPKDPVYVCGIAGHEHKTEVEATLCAGIDYHAGNVARGMLSLAAHLKAGRILSATNEAHIRTAAEAINSVLAQLDQKEEDTTDTESEDGKAIPAVLMQGEAAPVAELKSEVAVHVTAETSEEQRIHVDPEALRAMIGEVVRESFNQITGRVD